MYPILLRPECIFSIRGDVERLLSGGRLLESIEAVGKSTRCGESEVPRQSGPALDRSSLRPRVRVGVKAF
jgi:hypothetical protein